MSDRLPCCGHQVLDAVVAWRERSHARLSAVCVEVYVVGPTVGRSKNSISVEFIAPDLLVGVTVWDSGEYEEITTFVDGDRDPSVSVGEVVDAGAEVALLERVADDVMRRNQHRTSKPETPGDGRSSRHPA